MMPVIWRYAAIDATCREAQPAEAWLAPRERQVCTPVCATPGGAASGWPAGSWQSGW